MYPVKGVPRAWRLSNSQDNENIYISKECTKLLKENDVIAVEYLYRSFKNKLNGIILNEETDMDVHLQVSAFFNALARSSLDNFLVLIIVPDVSIIKWHYHLSVNAGLEVKLVTPETCPQDFDEETKLALLLQFSNIKLAEALTEYNYYSVVIDSFDEVATKLIVRKLYGKFNIGLTRRNFYTSPDQKLQWSMLNWSNPGCVGKLADFYEIDSDNFANSRNNYRHWWFRLTWKFCESFSKPSETENGQYQQALRDWAHNNKLDAEKIEKGAKRRKVVKNEPPATTETTDKIKQEPSEPATRTRRVYSSKTRRKKPTQIVFKAASKKQTKPDDEQVAVERKSSILHADVVAPVKTELNSLDSGDSSEDTIIYENEEVGDCGSSSSTFKLAIPHTDKNLVETFKKESVGESTTDTKESKSDFDTKTESLESKISIDNDENDIWTTMIKLSPIKKSNTFESTHENEVAAMETSNEPEGFFQSLVAKNESVGSEIKETDEFFDTFLQNPQLITGDCSKNKDGFSGKNDDNLGENSDCDIEAEPDDDFFMSLVSSEKRKSTPEKRESSNKRVDIDVEQVLKSADEILNS